MGKDIKVGPLCASCKKNPAEPNSRFCTDCGMEEDDDQALREEWGMEDE